MKEVTQFLSTLNPPRVLQNYASVTTSRRRRSQEEEEEEEGGGRELMLGVTIIIYYIPLLAQFAVF